MRHTRPPGAPPACLLPVAQRILLLEVALHSPAVLVGERVAVDQDLGDVPLPAPGLAPQAADEAAFGVHRVVGDRRPVVAADAVHKQPRLVPPVAGANHRAYAPPVRPDRLRPRGAHILPFRLSVCGRITGGVGQAAFLLTGRAECGPVRAHETAVVHLARGAEDGEHAHLVRREEQVAVVPGPQVVVDAVEA